MRCQNDKGMALTVAIIIIILLGLLAGYMTQMGYNQRRLADTAGGRRAKAYYRAQAGLVDANWRIRTNYTGTTTYTGSALNPPGSFAVDAYNPNAYQMDLDGDGSNDVDVDIGPVTNALTKQRDIRSIGLDT